MKATHNENEILAHASMHGAEHKNEKKENNVPGTQAIPAIPEKLLKLLTEPQNDQPPELTKEQLFYLWQQPGYPGYPSMREVMLAALEGKCIYTSDHPPVWGERIIAGKSHNILTWNIAAPGGPNGYDLYQNAMLSLHSGKLIELQANNILDKVLLLQNDPQHRVLDDNYLYRSATIKFAGYNKLP